ncbi:LacI family DNA-binding transcriptional regulator [Alteribacter populi]|uniref:LacI family DNA-binding transcriptional regulator n=1 Tax=Alteribacter populi TaxID=2011011 RepID=UPI000BBA7ED6|nr:LacI family DNA-binding transcriptional regulator [Alteribacter populi]
MKPTIKDVANAANVSIATVSRILNKQAGYSQTTKEHVMGVIAELGYHPNAIARGLVSKKTKTLGVLLPNVSNMFSSEVLDGIEQAAHENEYSVIICNTDRNGRRTLDYLKVLGEKKVDGLIFISEALTSEYYQAIQHLNIPFVLVSSMSYKYQVPYIKVDDKHASYQAVTYLIEKGHKDIALISGDIDDVLAGIPRVEGYCQALRDHRIEVRQELITYGDFGFESGKECMTRLIQTDQPFSAVFSTSEEMALGAMSVAHQNKINIPEDISFVGYDNTRYAEMSIPPLTTVAQPLKQMGNKAVEMILTMLETGKKAQSNIMPHSIVERESVKSRTK